MFQIFFTSVARICDLTFVAVVPLILTEGV